MVRITAFCCMTMGWSVLGMDQAVTADQAQGRRELGDHIKRISPVAMGAAKMCIGEMGAIFGGNSLFRRLQREWNLHWLRRNEVCYREQMLSLPNEHRLKSAYTKVVDKLLVDRNTGIITVQFLLGSSSDESPNGNRIRAIENARRSRRRTYRTKLARGGNPGPFVTENRVLDTLALAGFTTGSLAMMHNGVQQLYTELAKV